MKLGKILIAGAALVAFTAPAAAQTFNWWFDNSYYGAPDQIVTGTISGLAEGDNDAHGLTISITSTPNGSGPGNFGYVFSDGIFTVTNGEVTAASAIFQADNGSALFFGTHPGDGWDDTYYPELRLIQGNPLDGFSTQDYASSNPTHFSLAAAPAPEPASWALMVAGFGLAGAAMRRRTTRLSFD